MIITIENFIICVVKQIKNNIKYTQSAVYSRIFIKLFQFVIFCSHSIYDIYEIKKHSFSTDETHKC